jgi:flagellar rod protein FlaI
MEPWLVHFNSLCDLDLILLSKLAEDSPDTEVILQLVDKRDQILQEILPQVSENQQFATAPQWQPALVNTQNIVEQMHKLRAPFGKELHTYQRGSRSVQQYKKFL